MGRDVNSPGVFDNVREGTAALSSSPSVVHNLFGDAAEGVLPPGFQDMSDFRPVPDNQEYLYNPRTEQVFVAEFVEHKADVSDAVSARFFLEDVVHNFLEVESFESRGCRELTQAEMPHVATGAFKSAAMALFQERRKVGQTEPPKPVLVCLADVRLREYETDVLIALYTPIPRQPVVTGEANAVQDWQLNSIADAEAAFMHFLSSFKLKDPSILGGTGEDTEMAST